MIKTACIFIFFFLLSTFAPNAFSQHSSAGSVNYQHLLLQYDGRSTGLAGANVALPAGVEGTFANPAAIASVNKQQVFIGNQLLLDGVWSSPIGYLRPYNFGIFAVTLQGLSSGKVEVKDISIGLEPVITNQVAHTEYFTPSISFARAFLKKKLLAGVSIKGMYQRIVIPHNIYSSKAIGMDIGIQYKVNGDMLVTGMAFRNVGFEFSSFNDDESYATPLIFEAGISFVPRYLKNVRICADVNKTRGDYITIEPGMEIEVYPKTFFVRLGYPFSQYDIEEKINKLTGDKDENYVKSNWSTFACGIGLKAPLQNMLLRFDVGLQLIEASSTPQIQYSAVLDF
jgi:hypothetical protein